MDANNNIWDGAAQAAANDDLDARVYDLLERTVELQVLLENRGLDMARNAILGVRDDLILARLILKNETTPVMFVVVTDGDMGIECEGLQEAERRFEARVRNAAASDRAAPGTTVELWVLDQWVEDMGAPLRTWTKEVA